MRVTRGRILVIRGGAIGDFILTLPAIAALRAQFPDTHIEVLGYPHIAQLAQIGCVVDRVQPIDSRELAGFFAAGGQLGAEMADYFARFDVIISYLFDPDRIFQTNVARCSRAQFIVAPHRPNDANGVHAAEVFLKPLERLAIFTADPVPRIPAKLHANLGVRLAVHPSSAGNQTDEQWLELLARVVAKTSSNLLLVGGEAEADQLERLASKLPSERVEIARSLPLTELAAQLSSCRTFVGHDSGITHLAAALGITTLILWGEKAEQIWRPLGEHVQILHSQGSSPELNMESVWEILFAHLGG